MNLYYSPVSPNSRKVRVTAAILGIELDLIHVDITKGEQRSPDYLAKNPMGKVPLLDDGGFRLSESGAIMAYLADARPGNTIYPAERRARAEVNRWILWGAGHWSPAVGAFVFETMLKKLLRAGEPDPAQVARQEEHIRALATVLDAHLASREWVTGQQLTIADIAIGTSLMTALPAKAPLQPFGKVLAWFERLQALDAWGATEPPTRGP